jgi:acyl-CoA hydrolase
MTMHGGSPTDPASDHEADRLHRLSMTILMTPDMSAFAGNVHGGILLDHLDQVAYTCATLYARTYAVTPSADQVVFREPIHVGELVTFDASVNRTGRTSMEVGVRVTTQDLVRQTVRHTNSCYFTMAAIGADGRPVPVPTWRPQTVEERRRHLAAERRSQLRREIDRVTAEIKQTPHNGEVTNQSRSVASRGLGPPLELRETASPKLPEPRVVDLPYSSATNTRPTQSIGNRPTAALEFLQGG